MKQKAKNNFIDIIKKCCLLNSFSINFFHPSVRPRSFYSGKSMVLNNGFVLQRTKTTLTMQEIFHTLRHRMSEHIQSVRSVFKRSIKYYY